MLRFCIRNHKRENDYKFFFFFIKLKLKDFIQNKELFKYFYC